MISVNLMNRLSELNFFCLYVFMSPREAQLTVLSIFEVIFFGNR